MSDDKPTVGLGVDFSALPKADAALLKTKANIEAVAKAAADMAKSTTASIGKVGQVSASGASARTTVAERAAKAEEKNQARILAAAQRANQQMRANFASFQANQSSGRQKMMDEAIKSFQKVAKAEEQGRQQARAAWASFQTNMTAGYGKFTTAAIASNKRVAKEAQAAAKQQVDDALWLLGVKRRSIAAAEAADKKAAREVAAAWRRSAQAQGAGGSGGGSGGLNLGGVMGPLTGLRQGLANVRSLIFDVRTAMGVFLGGLIVKPLIDASDAMTSLAARAAAFSDKASDVPFLMEKIYETAQKSRTPLAAIATLYTRLAPLSEQLGKSQTQLLRITETVAKGIQIGGATPQESAAASQQLAQALASNRLGGDELRSLAENAPLLLGQIAKSLNMNTGEFIKWAHAGKANTEVVIGALEKIGPEIDKMFAKFPVTIGQATTMVGNAFTMLVGKANDATGASRAVAAEIAKFSRFLESKQALDGLVGTINAVGAAFKFLSAAVRTFVNYLPTLTAIFTTVLATAALARIRVAVEGIGMAFALMGRQASMSAAGIMLAKGAWNSMIAAGRGLLALIGGPIGLALIALTLGFNRMAVAQKTVSESSKTLTETQQTAVGALVQAADVAAKYQINTDGLEASIKAMNDATLGTESAANSAANGHDTVAAAARERARAEIAAAGASLLLQATDAKKRAKEIEKGVFGYLGTGTTQNITGFLGSKLPGQAGQYFKGKSESLFTENASAMQDARGLNDAAAILSARGDELMKAAASGNFGTTLASTVPPGGNRPPAGPSAAEQKKAAAEAMRLTRQGDASQQLINKMAIEELRARADLTQNIEDQAKLRIAEVIAERDRAMDANDYDVLEQKITDTARDKANLSEEEIARLRVRLIEQDRADALAQQSFDRFSAINDLESSILQARAEFAGTARERAAFEAEMLAKQQAASKAALDLELSLLHDDSPEASVYKERRRTLLANLQLQEQANQQWKDFVAIRREENGIAEEGLQRQIDFMQAEQNYATTAAEQYAIGERITAAQYELERQKLLHIAEVTKGVEHDKALADLIALDQVEELRLRTKNRRDMERAYADVTGAMEDMASAFENGDWDVLLRGLQSVIANFAIAFGPAGTIGQKIATVAGLANGVGNMVGGKGGSVLSGAGSGAMAGFQVGGPLGAAIGTVVGGLGGLLGFNSAKKKAEAEARRQAEAEARTMQGSGSVLGDSKAQTASLARAMDIAKSNWNQDLEYSSQMVTSLQAIESGISSLTSVIARQLSLTTGGMFDTSGLGLGTTKGGTGIGGRLGVGAAAGGLALGGMAGATAGLMGVGLGSLALGPMGIVAGAIGLAISALVKTKVTTSLKDQGLLLNGQTINDILANGASAQTFQEIEVTRKKSLLGLGLGSKTTTQTINGAADAGFNSEVTRIIESLRKGVLSGAATLGLDGAEATIDAFEVNLGKISVEGLTGEEIQAKLTAVFGQLADDLASAVIPGIEEFQRAGEGAFETLARLARDFEVVNTSLESIGTAFGDMTFASIGARERLIELSGGIDAFASKASFFAENFLTEAQRAAITQKSVSAAFEALNMAVPGSRQAFADIVQSLDLTTGEGQNLYVALLDIAPAFAKVTAAVEDAASALFALDPALGRQVEEMTREIEAHSTATETTRYATAAESDRAAAIAETTTRMQQQAQIQTDNLQAYADTTKAMADSRDGLLKTGNVAGLLANQLYLQTTDPRTGLMRPELGWSGSAGGFNTASSWEAAMASRSLAGEISANALRVPNALGSISSLMSAMPLGANPWEVPVGGGSGVANIIGLGMSQFNEGEKLKYELKRYQTADYQISPSYVTTAYRPPDYIGAQPGDQTGNNAWFASGYRAMTATGDNSYTLGNPTVTMNGAYDEFHQGISNEEGARRTQELIDQYNSVEAAMLRAQATSDAGVASIRYYSDEIVKMSDALNAAGLEAGETSMVLEDVIGRLQSLGDVMAYSAGAALAMPDRTDREIGNASIISRAAAIAAQVLTTQQAAETAKRLAEEAAFGNTSDLGVKKAALLIDGISAFDPVSFEKAFTRLNAALIRGEIDDAQYAALFNDALSTYDDTRAKAQELADAFDQLRESARKFADELSLNQEISPLSVRQRLDLASNRYEGLYSTVMADPSKYGDYEKAARDYIDTAKFATNNSADFEYIVAKIISDNRLLETIETPETHENLMEQYAQLSIDSTDYIGGSVDSLRSDMTAALSKTNSLLSDVSLGIRELVNG